MIVDSGLPEFGYELVSALPYAYHLYEKGELEATISGYDTSHLYYFSPDHKEVNKKRGWDNMQALWDRKFPNIAIHRRELDWGVWSPPPLKEHYSKQAIRFQKPTVVIVNRYNDEYHGKGKPHNFFNRDVLEDMFIMLGDKYDIVYAHLNHDKKYDDGVGQKNLHVNDLLSKHNVHTVQDLMDEYSCSWNETVLRVFAGCERFVTMNGGLCFLSGYFGGENIIYTKDCREVNDKGVNSFYGWFHKLGGSKVNVVRDYSDLLETIRQKWVEELPMINILVRTSGRERGFTNMINSIKDQTFKNWRVICSFDNEKSGKYIADHPVVPVRVNSNIKRKRKPKTDDYREFFAPNSYFNEMIKLVDDGVVTFIDDDDIYADENSLMKVAESFKADSSMALWRVSYKNSTVSGVIPPNEFWKHPPQAGFISGIGFAFTRDLWTDWEPFRRGDFRCARDVFNKATNHIWLDEVLCVIRPEEPTIRRDQMIRKKRIAQQKRKGRTQKRRI